MHSGVIPAHLIPEFIRALARIDDNSPVQASASVKTPWALAADGEVYHASERRDGPFSCLDCGATLFIRRSHQGTLHYYHQHSGNCSGGPVGGGEGLLHLAAKVAVSELNAIRVEPIVCEGRYLKDLVDVVHESGQIIFRSATLEPEGFPGFRPDVSVETDGGILLIEIKVSHEVDASKKQLVDDHGVDMIEITIPRHLHQDGGWTKREVVDLVARSAERKWIFSRPALQSISDIRAKEMSRLLEVCENLKKEIGEVNLDRMVHKDPAAVDLLFRLEEMGIPRRPDMIKMQMKSMRGVIEVASGAPNFFPRKGEMRMRAEAVIQQLMSAAKTSTFDGVIRDMSSLRNRIVASQSAHDQLPLLGPLSQKFAELPRKYVSDKELDRVYEFTCQLIDAKASRTKARDKHAFNQQDYIWIGQHTSFSAIEGMMKALDRALDDGDDVFSSFIIFDDYLQEHYESIDGREPSAR